MTTPAREYRVIGYTDDQLAGVGLKLVNTDPSAASQHPWRDLDAEYLTKANARIKAPRYAIRCSATAKRTGKPCGNYAMTGGRACRVHGGATKQAKRVAAQRIEALRLHRAEWQHRERVARWERRRAEVVANIYGWRVEDVLAQPNLVAVAERCHPALLARCGRRPA